MLLFSSNTSTIRFALAALIVTITNTIESIIKLIRIFIQYASKLVSSPVSSVGFAFTIMCAPTQLIKRIHVYTVICITGEL